MKNIVKLGLATVLATQAQMVGAVNTPTTTFGTNNASITSGVLEEETLPAALQEYVNYIMTFLYLIAVMYAIWGGFLILTAGGDEEKVKKGKTILIQGAIGLFVVFIAATLVAFILSALGSGGTTTTTA